MPSLWTVTGRKHCASSRMFVLTQEGALAQAHDLSSKGYVAIEVVERIVTEEEHGLFVAQLNAMKARLQSSSPPALPDV